ncbi:MULTISPECIES: hypothetical protein [unclassified Spirosoma]|uniref:hypothetical protein n=1 Tax=unclassified Spirosoma TaxID=2621999 RepID=UPI00096467D7|nr:MULTISPECIES: hypothetical protein [unclassified Spirosoma]MBN8820870.1 hypothetical protein [Spirosoma sp.]OJW70843.1 MAG: hypothetical protein BGO59_31940 [Spirosoma sp. 48-14]
MNTLSTLINCEKVDDSKRYRFNPVEDGYCQTTSSGNIVLHRRLVTKVLGINFRRTHLKIIEQITDNQQLYALLLRPAVEPQIEGISITRYKYSAVLKLNSLLDKLQLDYKVFLYSFISEDVLLNDGVVGIRLRLHDVVPLRDQSLPLLKPKNNIKYYNKTNKNGLLYPQIKPTDTKSFELKRIEELENENRQLKIMYADLSLQNEIMKKALDCKTDPQ